MTLPAIDPATGEISLAHISVAALGASNYTYACATPGETQVDWLTAQGQAFSYFGGVGVFQGYVPIMCCRRLL